MTTERLESMRAESMEHYGFGIEVMKRIKVCPRCGKTSPVDRQFCTECGHRLSEESLFEVYRQRHKVCPRCETVVADGSGYCPQCGEKLENTSLKYEATGG